MAHVGRREFLVTATAIAVGAKPLLGAIEAETPLRLWCDGVDFVIARSAEEAQEVVKHIYGSDVETQEEREPWQERPNEMSLSIFDEDENKLYIKKVSEWVAEFDAGYLASIEW